MNDETSRAADRCAGCDLSRGARDWLRHSEKVREAVRQRLPEIISNAEVLGGGHRTVRVPVKLLEHYRFRRQPESHTAAGQGSASPGDVLRVPQNHASGQDKGQGITEPGGVQFVLELAIDDIVDWLWEELELPNLCACRWDDRRGAQTRRPEPPRRAIAARPAPFHERSREATPRARRVSARLFRRRFALPAAGSPATPTTRPCVLRYGRVREYERGGSSACQDILLLGRAGLRRQYQYLETVFVAHTVDAGVPGTGILSCREREALSPRARSRRSSTLVDTRYDPERHNVYLFYASDGENSLKIERLPPPR